MIVALIKNNLHIVKKKLPLYIIGRQLFKIIECFQQICYRIEIIKVSTMTSNKTNRQRFISQLLFQAKVRV